MDADNLQTGLAVFAIITLLVAFLGVMTAVWIRTAPRADLTRTNERVDVLEAFAGKLDDRIVRLEAHVEHLPTKEDVHNLDRGLIHLTGIVEQQGERTMAMVRSLDRVENYLFSTPPPPKATPDGNRA